MKVLLLLAFLFPFASDAQDLIQSPDNVLTTNWRRLYDIKDGNGKWVANQRFIKRNDSFFVEIKAYERYGKDLIIAKGDSLKIHFIMHKGTITASCINTSKESYKLHTWSSEQGRFMFALYYLTPAQIDSIIQNKVRNIELFASNLMIDAEMENEWNYDFRSAAAAIISGRDINDRKIKIREE